MELYIGGFAQGKLGYVKAHAKELGIKPEVFEKTAVHIHVPEGAIPKDGPSAGITIVTTIVSLLSERTVSKYLAMTGEISLRGAVLPIGGLREKLTSAVLSGVKEVIIPKDNEKDLEEIPDDVLDKLKIYSCDRIEKVMAIVFDNEDGDVIKIKPRAKKDKMSIEKKEADGAGNNSEEEVGNGNKKEQDISKKKPTDSVEKITVV